MFVTVEPVGSRAVAMIVAGLLLLLASSFTSCNPIPLLEPVISTDLAKLALMFRLCYRREQLVSMSRI